MDTNIYYIIKTGRVYMTSYDLITDPTTGSKYPVPQYDFDYKRAMRRTLEDISIIHGVMGGTVYKCTETYEDVTGEIVDPPEGEAIEQLELLDDKTEKSYGHKLPR